MQKTMSVTAISSMLMLATSAEALQGHGDRETEGMPEDLNHIRGGLLASEYAGDRTASKDMPTGLDLAGMYELGAFGLADHLSLDSQRDPGFVAMGGVQLLSDQTDQKAGFAGLGMAIDAQGVLGGQARRYAGLTLEYQHVESDMGWEVDDAAPGVRIGTMERLTPEMFLDTELRYVTGDLDYWGVSGRVNYKLEAQVTGYGGVQWLDGELGFEAGARYSF